MYVHLLARTHFVWLVCHELPGHRQLLDSLASARFVLDDQAAAAPANCTAQ